MVKIWHIILGTFKNIFNIFDKTSLHRLNICNKCDSKRYLKGFGNYCNECGCIIKSKVTVKDEKCPNAKW